MSRPIFTHVVTPLNKELIVEAVGQVGPGGANHRYDITGFDTENNPQRFDDNGYAASFGRVILVFQSGPIKKTDIPNGVTTESVLAILIDHLEGFQRGPFACQENADALEHLRAAMYTLHTRTRERTERGVEGKMLP